MLKDHSDRERRGGGGRTCSYHYMDNSAKYMLYAPSHRQDSLYYTSHEALAGMRNSLMSSMRDTYIKYFNQYSQGYLQSV